ncbi:MAG: hypothetical protein DBY25_07170 [Clostridiales bacterium]|nr:MAG: hypothetical protein DBY25_07170 [Clostridiales bacterium]
MKTGKLLCALFAVLFCFSACTSVPAGDPKLNKLIDYYEGKLDPDIPKITVTAEITEEDGEKTVCYLPYDAYLRTGEEETETDRNKTWFADLMNNFQSLPILYDGFYLERETPSQLTIRFEQPPEGEIVIKDYGIFDPCGTANEADGLGPGRVGYIHTFDAAQELSFDLWLLDGALVQSELPELRGLRIECKIDGKQVEYYLLFRTNYMGGLLPFYGEDLSHLTPLEGLEEEK